jgi:hypothetical protein
MMWADVNGTPAFAEGSGLGWICEGAMGMFKCLDAGPEVLPDAGHIIA